MQIKRIAKKILTEMYAVKFWIAVAVIAILCLCANINGESASSDSAIYNLILHLSKHDMLSKGEMYSSYGVIMVFRSNYWFPIIVPIVAAIPYISRFANEWLTGYYYMRLPRSKRLSYALENVFVAAFTGFLVMCAGVLLFSVICTFAFPSYSSYSLSPEESIIAMLYGQTQAARLLKFIKVLVHVGLLGSIASVFSMILLTVVHDSFMALTLPMMLIYLSTKAAGFYMKYLIRNYGFDTPPLGANMISLLIPSLYADMESSFSTWFGVPDVLWHVYLLAIIAVMALIMICIVKRRNV